MKNVSSPAPRTSKRNWRAAFTLLPLVTLLVSGASAFSQSTNETDNSAHELSDQVVPYEKFGRGLHERNRLITELLDDAVIAQNRERLRRIEERDHNGNFTDLPDRRSFFGGDRFLSPGPLAPGIQLPTGATWRPSFFVFGSMRSAVQTFHQGPVDVSEWVNRLDIYGNLTLSGTERVLVGFRPLDREGRFSGYTFRGGSKKEGWTDALNLDPQTLFFEGDFGEIFPRLDPIDRHRLDYGFSIGRQPLLLQDGLMLDDTVDSIGITRHNMFLFGSSSARVSAFFGLNDVHRSDSIRDDHARLYALSSALDYDQSTIEIDAAYVDGDRSTGGDGVYLGLGQIRRFGHWNSTLRANASYALQGKTTAVSTGGLLTHELSRTMPYNTDILYLNNYVGVDNYTSAARGPATGGPLGRLGLLNRAVGLGDYGPPLSNLSGNTVGASLGYQHFFDPLAYHQLLTEIGVRMPYGKNTEKTTTAASAQYQWGAAPGLIWLLGAFGSVDRDGSTDYGMRTEFLLKF